jgi:hypothetical protein
MNVRRGLNRLFIVAWVVYGVWLAWYAFQAPIDNDRSFALLEIKGCENQVHDAPLGAAVRNCANEYIRHVAEFEQARNEQIHQPSWIGFVLLALIVPPPIVYGVVFLLVKVVSWVVVGFRISKPANPV